MKKSILILAVLLIAAAYSCKKKTTDNNQTTPPTNTDNYSSTANFFAVNASPMLTYTFDASTGGVFTTAKGTVITVPANAFKTQAGGAVVGNVTLQFKDVYKKSDMVLNKLTTHCMNLGPMKSAGMFYVKAMQGAIALKLAPNKKLTVNMPFNGAPVDNQMQPFILKTDTLPKAWTPSSIDSVTWLSFDYIFSAYQYNSSADSGTWCNNDNANYFSSYPMTTLTFIPLDNVGVYNTELFLLFTGVNSMLWMHYAVSNFPYNFAPIGMQCTAVATGVKNGKLYSSFTPITITNNLTVNFSLSETTTADFKAQLDALN